MPVQIYKDFDLGVINAIEATRLPLKAFYALQNLYQADNEIRKMPGLTEINPTAIGANPVSSVFVFHQIVPKATYRMAVSGTDLWKFDPGSKTFSSVYSGLIDDGLVEMFEHRNRLYFGSPNNKWRVFDAGTTTQPVGGSNGNATDAPRKFSMIVFNPYSGRFFAIGDKDNPDYLYFSAHQDAEGIEKWPDANIQIIDSILGDTPQFIDIYEGRITIISENSINSGSVVGVPENWQFVREKALTGTIARRSVKRRGNNFYYLTKDFEICSWPDNKIITEGRVKFSINPNKAHLACAEIVEDRYYDITFESGEAVSSDKYHTWRYDILADRWSGAHRQRNVISKYYDHDNRVLLCGGTDNLAGFVMEQRGRNIKNTAMKCRLISPYSDYDLPFVEKRFNRGWVKAKQAGDITWETLKDDSFYNHTVTLRDNAEITTTQKVFGRGALRMDGSSDSAYALDADEFDFAAGDFTLDLRARFASLASNWRFISKWETVGQDQRSWLLDWQTSNNLRFQTSTDGINATAFTFAWTPVINTWYHLRFIRTGNTLRAFIDGVQIGTDQTFSGTFFDSTAPIALGAVFTGGVLGFNGFIDEVRVSKGIARSTAAFTVPTSAYEADSYDVLLLHCDDYPTGALQLVVNTNNQYGNRQSQKILLDDPANENTADTNAVKEAVVRRFDIFDGYGLGTSVQYELLHEVSNGEFAFSELAIDYDLKNYKKENRV